MRRKYEIKIGDKFDKLTIISEPFTKEIKEGKIISNRAFVRCKCDCGIERDAMVKQIASGNLKSCGCNRKTYEVEYGQQFNNLIVINPKFGNFIEYNNKKYTRTTVQCKCSCGNIVEVEISKLVNGERKSCSLDCWYNSIYKTNINPSPKSYRKLYKNWIGMKMRCYGRRKDKKYQSYIDKNIQVCSEWLNDFLAFERWALQNGWQDGLVVDRIDSDKDYMPGNIRFVTKSQNSKNVVGSRNEIIARLEQELIIKNQKILELEIELQEYRCNKR